MAIAACKKQGKYVGICGQGPSDHPDFAQWLAAEGISSLSLNPDSVVATWKGLARMALAVSLFKDGGLSWMQAASYAYCTASDFMIHLSRLGIPVIDQSQEEVVNDIDTLQKWLAQ